MRRSLLTTLLFCSLTVAPVSAQETPALGPRIGMLSGPDTLYLGLQTELTHALDGGVFAPSLDVGIDDNAPVSAQFDVRWYLFHLPGTGLRFYGAIGPEVVLSPDIEVGLDLTAGLNIPMSGRRRYNVELRFGFGDVPDFAIGLGVLFPLR